jgi:hypothetical protein
MSSVSMPAADKKHALKMRSKFEKFAAQNAG